jgi:hypothetical protein
VICEIMKDDGTMARLPDLQLFAAEHGLKIGTIADLIEHRSRNEAWSRRSAAAAADRLRRIHRPCLARQAQPGPAPGAGQGQLVPRRRRGGARARAAVGAGRAGNRPPMHSWSLDASLKHIAARRPRRGRAAQLRRKRRPAAGPVRRHGARRQAPERGRMDLRTYGVGAQILRECGVHRMNLMGNAAPHAQHGRLRPGDRRLHDWPPPTINQKGTMFGADKGTADRLDGKNCPSASCRRASMKASPTRWPKACWDELLALGVHEDNIEHVLVPGALEVPVALQAWRKAAATTR